MSSIRCPKCQAVLVASECQNGLCPVCRASLATSADPARGPQPASPSIPSPRPASPGLRWAAVAAIVIALLAAGLYGLDKAGVFGRSAESRPPATEPGKAKAGQDPVAAPDEAKQPVEKPKSEAPSKPAANPVESAKTEPPAKQTTAEKSTVDPPGAKPQPKSTEVVAATAPKEKEIVKTPSLEPQPKANEIAAAVAPEPGAETVKIHKTKPKELDQHPAPEKPKPAEPVKPPVEPAAAAKPKPEEPARPKPEEPARPKPEEVAKQPIAEKPKTEPGKEPEKQPDGSVHLDDPKGEYEVEELNDAKDLKLTGRIGTLRVAAINSGSILDAGKLEAGEIFMQAVNERATVALNAPKGSVVFEGSINEKSNVFINAPEGKVTFVAPLGSDSKITIHAKEVLFGGTIHGGSTLIVITLSKGGRLGFREIVAGALHYKRADPKDPEPTVEMGKVVPGASVKEIQ